MQGCISDCNGLCLGAAGARSMLMGATAEATCSGGGRKGVCSREAPDLCYRRPGDS